MLIDTVPQRIDQRAATFPGALVPVVMPVEWLPPQAAGRWALDDDRLPFPQRVHLALEGGLEAELWPRIQQHLRGRAMDASLQRILARWAADEQARLGLPAADGGVIVHAPPQHRGATMQRHAARALQEVRQLFAPLGWPRWAGPVVLVHPDKELAPQNRPVLPMVAWPQVQGGGDDQRAQFARVFAQLALDYSGPPQSGWPTWLSSGITQIAAERAQGRLPSPLGALRQRQAAGIPAIQGMLRGHQDPDPDLAFAVAALLTSERRQHRWPVFMDLLRNNIEGEQALSIAYDLSLQDLLRVR
ncbi:MAG: hypothetical protein EA401_13685 [Planctomycetota bacterium]|nr:MAG: hypothetical protein EA401_13685 [Planctomycetota bacterium]